MRSEIKAELLDKLIEFDSRNDKYNINVKKGSDLPALTELLKKEHERTVDEYLSSMRKGFVELSDEETFAMYMKCKKEELAKMLIQCNKLIGEKIPEVQTFTGTNYNTEQPESRLHKLWRTLVGCVSGPG